MALRLIDSSVWIAFLRPRPDPRLVRAVRRALMEREAAVAAPVVVEVLSGIRNRDEYLQREQDFRTLPMVAVDGEAAFLAARIGEALAETGKAGKTVDLLLAGAAITASAEIWSLPDEHFRRIQLAIERINVRDIKPLRLAFLP